MKTFKQINKFGNTKIYQATLGKFSTTLEIDYFKDRKGTLKRVHCSKLDFFESYSMIEIKNRVFQVLERLNK